MYRFQPNEYAKRQFNLKAKEYVGDSMTYLVQDALGEDNYRRYVIAQDPLFEKNEGEIRILTNPDEPNSKKWEYKSIGHIQRLG